MPVWTKEYTTDILIIIGILCLAEWPPKINIFGDILLHLVWLGLGIFTLSLGLHRIRDERR